MNVKNTNHIHPTKLHTIQHIISFKHI